MRPEDAFRPDAFDQQERSRRQQALRTFILLCVILSLMEGMNSNARSNVSVVSNKMSAVNGDGSSAVESPFVQRVNEIIDAGRDPRLTYPRNVTGMYRGLWERQRRDKAPASSNYGNGNGTAIPSRVSWDGSAGGSVLMQLKSVPIDHLNDLTFVYGVVKLFGAGPKSSDMLFPLQGALKSALATLATTIKQHILNRRINVLFLSRLLTYVGTFLSSTGLLTLLPSPSGAQHLYLAVPSAGPATMNAAGSGPDETDIKRKLSEVKIKSIKFETTGDSQSEEHDTRQAGGQIKEKRSSIETIHIFHDVTKGLIFWATKMMYKLIGSLQPKGPDLFAELEVSSRAAYAPAEHRSLEASHSNGASFTVVEIGNSGLKIFVSDALPFDSANQGAFSTSLHDFTDSNATYADSNSTSTLSTSYFRTSSRDNDFIVQALGNGALPQTFISLQSTLQHAMSVIGLPLCPVIVGMHAKPQGSRGTSEKDVPLLPTLVAGSPVAQTPAAGTVHDTFTSILDGQIKSSECGLEFALSAQSYHLEVEKLERKAGSYAIAVTAICFVQVGFLLVQLRHAQPQAVAVKVSVLCICAQALLDAMVCIGHLLLSAALPTVFFSHFMWIAVLKLLIFCVFEMRAVVAVYQARYAQEVSTQGWSGLRRRLATLHIGFYSVLFAILFLTFTLRSRPVLLIFLLYSCWVPQIVHNSINGTRRALHPAYLCGMALSRLFIPLYLLGCPQNFVYLLFVDPTSFSTSAAACIVLVAWTVFQLVVLLAQVRFSFSFIVNDIFYILHSSNH